MAKRVCYSVLYTENSDSRCGAYVRYFYSLEAARACMRKEYADANGKEAAEWYQDDDNFVTVTEDSITVHDGMDFYCWVIGEVIPEDEGPNA